MVVTLIIAVRDEADLPSGHKRKKTGDIIAVCPEDHYGGVLTRKTHLLVKVDLGPSITNLADARKLMIPQFSDGALWWKGFDDTGAPLDQPVVAKRRYKIPFPDMVALAQVAGRTIDMGLLLDPEVDYQPIQDITFAFNLALHDNVQGRKLKTSDLTAIRDVDK